jgi:mannose-1-phosphate guanylyltransferase / phosphomannomutase
MQLVILAGGKGTRLGLTDIPKPMIQITGKPLLLYQIELAKRYDITEIFILSGYLANVIIDYFGDGSAYGVKISHIIEPKPLGTAGAVKLLKNKLKDRFLVFYGDIVMDFDIPSFINYDKNMPDTLGTILTHPNSHPHDSDLVETDSDKNVKSFLPKPHNENEIYHNLVNAALYILSPRIMDYIEDGVFADFGKDIFPFVIKKGEKLRAYSTPEYIKDMGTKDRLDEVNRDLLSGKVRRYNRVNKRPAVFLDCDEVINRDMDKDISFENFELLPGAAQAVKRINESGCLCIAVTNQSMVAKGFINFEDLEIIHKKMETSLGMEGAYLDGIYFCPHKACDEFNIDINRSWMIGDSPADMSAGKSAGCKTIMVGEQTSLEANYQKADLSKAVQFVLESEKYVEGTV